MTAKATKKEARARDAISRRKKALPQKEEARFVINRDGVLVHATVMFAQLLDQTRDQAEGKRFSHLVAFADPDSAFKGHNLFGPAAGAFVDTLREGAHKVLLPGRKTPVTLQFDRVTAEDGGRFMVGCALTDPTDRENIREKEAATRFLRLVVDEARARQESESTATPGVALGQSDGELRHFLNMSGEVMAIAAREGTFSRVNRAFNDVLGYNDEALRRMNFMDLVYPDDRPHIRALLHGLVHAETAAGDMISFETRIVTRDQSVRSFEWRQKRVGDFIYSVGRDITATKTHEAALRRQQEQLAEAQAIGRMGHWYWKIGEEALEWSDQIYAIFGVEKGTFIPTLDNINALLDKEEDAGRLLQAFQRAIIAQTNYDTDFRIVRSDGTECFIRCEGKCRMDEDGDVIALFGIMQDMTEQMRHEQELRAAKEAAERAYAAKSQFLANMSHELRTPLNAIIGFSEMMQRQLLGPIGTEKYMDYIAGIRESGEHLLDLISDILDMSKIEAGKYELDLEKLNLAKVVHLAAHMMEGRALEGQIRLETLIDNETLEIVADRRAVMQILLNLLSNALKFTQPDGVVQISCQERKDDLLLTVSDTGAGIPAHRLKDIARPFEQASSHYTREHEGTGLGLAITKELAEMHGGRMKIASTLGVGTTVTVRLPYNAYDYIKKKRQKTASSE
ncbi:MAG: PAS domain-containing protein [Alphaproteobacteria bacterium]|nr:PAS domain-containing protein [Alphaproteobacteria bacterium]